MNIDSQLLKTRWSRIVSLLLASPLALVLLIHPAAMLDFEGGYSHSQMMLIMLGISSGFIHGMGFDPQSRIWQWFFHPLLGWILMAMGYGVLLTGQVVAG